MSQDSIAAVRFGRTKVLMCIAAVAAAIVGYLVWRQVVAPDPLNPLGYTNVARDVEYVGDRECAQCHAAIASTYERTAMGRSWRSPANAEPIEDYAAPHEVVDETGGYRYQVYREGDRAFQREYRLDKQGEVTHSQVREVSYVLGSGSKGRAYVTESNGYLTIMPVAWYSQTGRWDLNPDYHRNNLRFSRDVVVRCIVCHNSYPDYVAGSNNRYREPMPQGIGCERCHGPGELHVKGWKKSAESFARAGAERSIVNPVRLPADLQQDVCLQCHLTTPAVFLRRGEYFDYRPGQPLGQFRSYFRPEGEKFTVVSHGSRAALSRCFTESGGTMTCIYCHDPHVPTSEVPNSFYNSRCLSCHQPDSCSRTAQGTASETESAAHRSNNCVACHMPREKPSDIEHTVTTDHWIRRPAPARGQPAESTTKEFVPLVDWYHDSELGEQGIAHLLFGGITGRPRYVAHGAQVLREAVSRSPGNLRWQCWMGFALQREGRLAEAASHLEQAMRGLQSDKDGLLPEEERVLLQFELAQLYRQTGRPARALELAQSLLESAPDYIPAYELCAELNLALGHHEAASQAARAGVERNPATPRLWWVLAFEQFEMQKSAVEALASLKRAIELDPQEPRYYTKLAAIYESLGQFEQAESARRQARRE